MAQKVAGTCYIKVDGTQLTISGGGEAPLMNVKRDTVVPGYFKEVDKAAWLKFKAVHTPDMPLKLLTTGGYDHHLRVQQWQNLRSVRRLSGRRTDQQGR